MDWEATRAEFPTLRRCTFLNTCSLGPLSRRARAAVGEFLDLWEAEGAAAWYETWLGEVDALRGKVARVLGARPDEIAILPSVSAALSTFASALDHSERPEAVVGELDFPTIPYQWLAKPDVSVRFAESADGITLPAEAFARLLSPRTAVVATSRVLFTTGAVTDVAAVARAAREVGARVLVDDYQGTGQVPVDVGALGVDALVGGGLKWLLGGPGFAFLYVRRETARELAPTVTSWFAHAEQFRFDPRRFEPHPTARRFELGTPSVASVYAASAGLDVVLDIGPARIRERTMRLVDDLLDRLRDAKLAAYVPEDRAERSGIVAVASDDPARDVRVLAAERIVVDKRPGRVRVSPYFFNTEEENARVVDALRRSQS